MTNEILVGLSFVLVVAAIFVAAGGVLLQWVSARRRGLTASLVFWKRCVLGLAGFGLLCVLYGALVEPYWPEIVHLTIASARFPANSPPIRFIQLSDIHSDPKIRLERKLPAMIAAERPDFIVFTGDAANSPGGLPVFKDLIRQLVQIAPVYAVKGNWDAWFFPEQDRFKDTGAIELTGKPLKFQKGKAEIWITGVAADRQESADQALTGIPAGAPVLFLHHYPYPDILSESSRHRVDLFCAGHVHGGQVALPLYGALITLSRWGKRFERGLYDLDPMKLYVNRGIGMEGGSAPRVRFGSRPEITVFDWVPPR